MKEIVCPYCGASHYMRNYSITTAMYFPPVYKDGININPDRNITTNVCSCCEYGQTFSYRMRYGEMLND